MTIREAILSVVNQKQGVKNVNLTLDVLTLLHPITYPMDDYNRELAKLVRDNEIIKIEYVLPNMEYGIKSFYLPKGTKIGER